jgi:hypothetical protein
VSSAAQKGEERIRAMLRLPFQHCQSCIQKAWLDGSKRT